MKIKKWRIIAALMILAVQKYFCTAFTLFIKSFDRKIMNVIVSNRELVNLSRMMMLFFVLMSLTLPLVKNFSDYYLILTLAFGGVMIVYAVKIEKKKKELNIETYMEIVDFLEGNPVERTLQGRKKKLRMEVFFFIME